MTKDRWKKLIQRASSEHDLMDVLCEQLMQEGKAKELLRENGFGVGGQSLLMTVQEIIREYKNLKGICRKI